MLALKSVLWRLSHLLFILIALWLVGLNFLPYPR